MVKLVGYVEMKKKVGKILFVEQDGVDGCVDGCVGKATDKIFLFDDLSQKIKPDSVGHEVVVSYGCGYNGKAFVADVVVK